MKSIENLDLFTSDESDFTSKPFYYDENVVASNAKLAMFFKATRNDPFFSSLAEGQVNMEPQYSKVSAFKSGTQDVCDVAGAMLHVRDKQPVSIVDLKAIIEAGSQLDETPKGARCAHVEFMDKPIAFGLFKSLVEKMASIGVEEAIGFTHGNLAVFCETKHKVFFVVVANPMLSSSFRFAYQV